MEANRITYELTKEEAKIIERIRAMDELAKRFPVGLEIVVTQCFGKEGDREFINEYSGVIIGHTKAGLRVSVNGKHANRIISLKQLNAKDAAWIRIRLLNETEC